MHNHSLVHSSIGTPSGRHLRAAALGLLVRRRFQVLFHSPHRGAFHRSLAVLVRYRSCCRYLALESGLPSFRRPSTGAAVLACYVTPGSLLRVRVSHPLRTRFPVAFPSHRTHSKRRPCGNARIVAQPQPRVGHSPHARSWFRLFPVRSPLLGEYISFPRGTKMFQFPRFPPPGL